MNINLHIERLILDGLPLASRQSAFIKEAVEAELTRLLAENGLSAGLQTGGAIRSLQANSIEINAETKSPQIGEQIARSVYDSFGKGGASQ